ncbi:MAG: hypothetical protein K9J27_05245 [Bacteroidales bacterium]|nr:hypothetical protein [Bacteroidales bacterium]MCF8334031.1 hypothetical protein [Bacteroidales bacterium]
MKVHLTIWIVLISTLTFGQDNIFSPGKTYLYAVEYTAEGITTMDTIKIAATGRPWRTDPEKQLEIVITYSFENLDTSMFAGQSSIGWVNSDTTGAVDNKKSCWFHPPRHNQYKLLELAPFPRVEYPLKVGNAYSRILFIGEGWGDISNKKVVWHYKVTGQNGGLWKISARAIPDNKPTKTNWLDFTFSKKEGFTELYYTLYNETTVKMTRK